MNCSTESAPSVSLTAPLAAALAALVQSLGQEQFVQEVVNTLSLVCGADSGGAMTLFRHRRPRQLLHRFDSTQRTVPDDAYLNGPYVLDPHYQRFLQGCDSGAYWLADVAPDDFYESEYYRVFYSQIGVSDSIDVLWRIDADTGLVFFLERSARNRPFDQSTLARLRLILPAVLAVVAKHHEISDAPAAPTDDDLTHRKVQTTIEHFGSSLLTKREQQVLFYALSGYSSGLTAERLNTSEGTVKIHRKNIYRKLEIGSQVELFSLFIQCIPYAKPGTKEDPLTVLQGSPAALK
jgi:DNA-binding CsgD family transcriptional regulator